MDKEKIIIAIIAILLVGSLSFNVYLALPRRTLEYKKEVKIIWDGRQFTIRIPKKFATRLGVDNTDVFEFNMVIPPHDSGQKPRLIGEWVKK